MPITVLYNNNQSIPCTLRPTPFISINTAINKTGAGETIGVTYSITLTGTILADRGSPFGADSRRQNSGYITYGGYQYDPPFMVDDNGSYYTPVGYGPMGLFYTGTNRDNYGPPPQIVDSDEALESILSKQRAIRSLFARDGQTMLISPVHMDQDSMRFNPRVISISFQEGNYVDRCEYTIELEADTLRDRAGNVDNEGLTFYWKDGGLVSTPLEGSTVFDMTDEAGYLLAGQYFIQDFSEEWSLETDEANAITYDEGVLIPRTYSISHSISATGKTHYLPNGVKLRAWMQAKGFVQSRLMIIEDGQIFNYPNSSNTSLAPNLHCTTATNTRPDGCPFGAGMGGLIGQGTLDLIAQYGGFNRVMSETVDEAGGSYSLTETWLLASGQAYETYNISISKSSDSVNTEVSIDGTIKGLSAINPAGYGGTKTASGVVERGGEDDRDRAGEEIDDRPFHYGLSSYGPLASPIVNATSKYYDISDSGGLGYKSQIYKRANNRATSDDTRFRRLNPEPLSRTLGINDTEGTISYNVSYNNRPINILSNTLYETISINDTYPGDVFATIPVIGRKTGPILQYIGGRTEYRRDLSIEVLVDRDEHWGNPAFETIDIGVSGHVNNSLGPDYLPLPSSTRLLPQKPSIMEPNRTELQQLVMQISPMNEPGIRKYFVAPPTESWDPKEGKYSLNIQWTYELEN